MMTAEDRRRTAYHEGGHAIVGMLTHGADPVRKVSIIPRGLALGVTFAAPESDRFNYREPEVQAKIKVALGGRAAEEVVYGETSTGAESDIQQLTEIARQMVGRWGMSDGDRPDRGAAAGRRRPAPSGRSRGLAGHAEARRRRGAAHRRRGARGGRRAAAREPRQARFAREALLEHETLDEEDAYAAAGVPRSAGRGAETYSAAARSRTDGPLPAEPGNVGAEHQTP